MTDLSISIVNTSNWKYLEPCIKAIIDNTQYISYEILVVDNASDDGSADLIAKNFPEVILSITPRRYGFAKNNNINLKKSGGRYLMLLNDDTLVQPNSLENAVAYLDTNPDVGMVGCQMLNPDGTVQYSSGRKFLNLLDIIWAETGISTAFSKNPVFARRIIGNWDHNTIREIDLPQESGMILRQNIINNIGLLDEEFFMFGEGADWCRRIRQAGWKIVFLPECKIIHFGGTTNQRTSLGMFLQSYKSTYIYFRKESRIISLCYRIIILLIYFGKFFLIGLKQIFLWPWRRQYLDILKSYRALLYFVLFRINDPNYPFLNNCREDLT